MLPLKISNSIYFYKQPIDFRNGINGLSHLVKELFNKSPLSGDLFVFRSKRSNSIKILYWEKNGFCLWHKRLSKDRFIWPKYFEIDKEIQLSYREFRWLLDGLNLKYLKPHQSIKFEKIS